MVQISDEATELLRLELSLTVCTSAEAFKAIPGLMCTDGWPIFAICWQMWGCRPPTKAPELELRQLWATRR